MEKAHHKGPLKLSYSQVGKGKQRLVFLHGLCGNKDVWSEQLSHLQSRYEILGIDCLGQGASSPIAAEEMLRATTAILSDFLKSLPALPTVLIGHSVGGFIVNNLMDLPGLSGAVFVDSPCLYSETRLKGYQEHEKAILTATDPRARVAEWFSHFVKEPGTAEARAKIVGEARRASPQWIARFMRSVEAPIRHRPPCPVLVMEGEQYFPEGNGISWQTFYPDAKLWRYTENGHFYFLQDPEPFNQALIEFVG